MTDLERRVYEKIEEARRKGHATFYATTQHERLIANLIVRERDAAVSVVLVSTVTLGEDCV